MMGGVRVMRVGWGVWVEELRRRSCRSVRLDVLLSLLSYLDNVLSSPFISPFFS